MKGGEFAANAPILFAGGLVLAFLAVDRFYVAPRAENYNRAISRSGELASLRVRAHSDGERGQALGRILGEEPKEAAGIDFLNDLVRDRHLTKVEIGRAQNLDGATGAPFQVTVRGRYGNLVLLLRDLEAAVSPTYIRDVRITKVTDSTDLEMRLRLEMGKAAS